MTDKKTEALKLALEALEPMEDSRDDTAIQRSITAIRSALAEQPAQQQEPVAIEYWLQDTMESGRWVTTDNMAKATAEKMLSGEYGDVYPQGRIVEPSPPPSKPLTDEMKKQCPYTAYSSQQAAFMEGWLKAEAAHGIKGDA